MEQIGMNKTNINDVFAKMKSRRDIVEFFQYCGK